MKGRRLPPANPRHAEQLRLARAIVRRFAEASHEDREAVEFWLGTLRSLKHATDGQLDADPFVQWVACLFEGYGRALAAPTKTENAG